MMKNPTSFFFKSKFKLKIKLTLTLVAASVSATALSYVVKTGETLSQIAQKQSSQKIYGNNGSLNKIIALNPQIKNPNFIKIAQKISIGEFIEEKSAQAESQSPDRTIATEPDAAVDSTAKKELEKEPVEKRCETTTPFIFKRRSLVAVSPYFSFLGLESKDNATHSKSTVASKYSTGFTTSYIQNWSERFQSAVHLKIGKINFEKPTNSNRALNASDTIMTGIGLETNHNLNENLSFKLNANYSKELFVRAISTQSDAVDALYVPSFGSKISYNMIALDPFIFGVSGKYSAKMSASAEGYEVRSGSEYGASIYLKQFTSKNRETPFEAEFNFSQRKQNTNVSTQVETHLIITLTYLFSLGKQQGEGQ
jgi:LysM repeat protein